MGLMASHIHIIHVPWCACMQHTAKTTSKWCSLFVAWKMCFSDFSCLHCLNFYALPCSSNCHILCLIYVMYANVLFFIIPNREKSIETPFRFYASLHFVLYTVYNNDFATLRSLKPYILYSIESAVRSLFVLWIESIHDHCMQTVLNAHFFDTIQTMNNLCSLTYKLR